MIQILLLTLGIVLSALHFFLNKSKTSRLRKPGFAIFLYKYWLFFVVGISELYYGLERLYYAWQLAQTFHTPISASLQYDLSLYCLSLAILGLLAPFTSRNFRAAVIIGYSLVTMSAASLQLFELLTTENYSFTTIHPVAYSFGAPLVLIGLFFFSDKKKLF